MLSSANPERYLFVETTLLMEWKNNAETNYKSSCLKTGSIAKKKNLQKFGAKEVNQSAPSAFSTASVNTFYELWNLLNLTTADYISNKVDIGIQTT